MILITGSTGFLGSYTIPHLVRHTDPSRIVCLVPKQKTVRMSGGKISEDDLTAKFRALGVSIRPYPARGTIREYAESINDTGPIRLVFYMAANNDQALGFSELFEDNVAVTGRFIDALGSRLKGATFVFASSVMAGAADKLEKRLGAGVVKSILPYGMTKKMAEEVIRSKAHEYGFSPIILRLGSIYGDRSSTGLIRSVEGLMGLSQMVPIPFFPGRASVVHVSDVAGIFAEIAASKTKIAPGIYNVNDTSPLPIGDFVRQAAVKAGKKARQFNIPGPVISAIRFIFGLGMRFHSSISLSLSALFDDIFVSDDARIWAMLRRKPRPFHAVIPVFHEAVEEFNEGENIKTAILGCTGFIGSRIVKHMIEKGFKVRCGVHSADLPEDLRGHISSVKCDTSDRGSLTHLFRDQEVVIYAAGLTTAQGSREWPEYLKANVEGVANVVGACADAGVKKLIFLGSQASHSGATGRYGISKYLGEKIVEASKLNWTILKPGQVIGQKSLVSTLYSLSSILPVFFIPSRTPRNLELVDVEDVAEFISEAALDKKGRYDHKIIYLGSEERMSLEDLMDFLWNKYGKKPIIFKVPKRMLLFAYRILRGVGIRIPLTPETLDGLYTPLPDFDMSSKVQRHCNKDPRAVLKTYL